MMRALANSAIHPSEVGNGKWVVIHVIRYMDYGVNCEGLAWLVGT